MAVDYDNILLVPKGLSTVAHRGDVDMRSDFYGLYPIFSSPMKGLSGTELVIQMGKLNCLGILHRFDTFEQRVENIKTISKASVPFGVAIGINNFEAEKQIAIYAKQMGAMLICVDIANGYLPQLNKVGADLFYLFDTGLVSLMAGNVVTKEGAEYLKNSYFDYVRVGIGNGAECITRTVTSVGRNQLRALQDCSVTDVNLVSDGGINTSGKAVLSFFHGADFVMLGGLLANAYEKEDKSDTIYGMASERNHLENNKAIKSIEGREIQLDPKNRKPLKEIIDNFLWGIRSACTYGNCKSYKDIPYNFYAERETI